MDIKQKVFKFLEDNASATHKQCLEAGIKVSESHFSRIRKVYKKGLGKAIQDAMVKPEKTHKGKRSYNRIDYTVVDDFFSRNPTGNFSQFKEEYPLFQISDAAFYLRRGGASTGAKNMAPRQGLYMTIWSYPVDQVGCECGQARKVLNDFIDTLNKARKTNWQVIELKSPAVLEVRETTRRG